MRVASGEPRQRFCLDFEGRRIHGIASASTVLHLQLFVLAAGQLEASWLLRDGYLEGLKLAHGAGGFETASRRVSEPA